MYISMTGFCRATKDAPWGNVTFEMSSVNHRYQEIYVRLPREFQSMEPWFQQKLRRSFKRGKLQARVEVAWNSSLRSAQLNGEVLKKYHSDICSVVKQIDALEDVRIDSLLNLPGVFETPGTSIGDEDLQRFFGVLIDEALDSWDGMRRIEGEHLAAAILEQLAELGSLADKISSLWEPAKNAAFEAMKKRLEKTLESVNGTTINDSRFIQEAVIISDRWDISEELARLSSHITKFRDAGDSDESNGRKLDFLVQEMNREVNTLDSKVSDAQIRWLAVEAKTTLEKMREQIQNLE